MTSKGASKLRLEYVSIDTLKKWQDNPRVMPDDQAKALRANIQRFGIVDPIIINKLNMIIGGHQRLDAAASLGIKQVPVVRVDVKGKDLKVLNLALNRISGDWDEAKLAPILFELKDLPEIDLTGFQPQEIASLIADLQLEDGKEDVIPELPTEPISKLGDVWQCGRHRVMCGDSTKQEDVSRLFEEQKADSIITDPPYGVDYGEKTQYLKDHNKSNREARDAITSDALDDYPTFFRNFLEITPLNVPNTAYVFQLGRHLHDLRSAFDAAGFTFSEYLVWVKNSAVLGRSDYQFQNEFVVYGWRGSHKFYSNYRTTVLQYDKPHKSPEHPTTKPLMLVEQLIQDGSPPNGTIYDAFLGSGTTLLASERLGRICYGMEIEPCYVDVAVKRWEQFTGQKAEKLGTT
jgi:DNA modification methylase